MNKLTTKEFNDLYKRNFREYFDKPLKKDGFYKKGTINFYRINKLGMIETLNFQKHREELNVNCAILPIYCGSTNDSITIGLRLGKFMNTRYEHWWDIKDDESMKKSMQEMLNMIQKDLYEWFNKMENEKEIIDFISKSYSTVIYRYITQAASMAKFKRYDEILQYVEKVKKEYMESWSEEERQKKEWLKKVLDEALLLERKLKEGKESIDQYIIEREQQSLIELGLEKLIK